MTAQFATLMHAYGRADDTPAHLAALAGDDHDARRAALEHLWSAIIHQGTAWTATPPAALTVAGLVGDPRLAGEDRAALRANLLRFLAAVAEAGRSASEELERDADPAGVDVDAAVAAALDEDAEDEIFGDEVLGQAVYARAVLGCRDAAPALLGAALAALSDVDATVRAAAAYAVSACCATLAATTDTAAIGERFARLAAAAGPDERAALVLAIGDLGLAPRAHLGDPHPGVRACAALAPALADDPAATAELLTALDDPAATDDWFTRRPPQLEQRIRFSLVAAAVARVRDPDRLLPAALAIAPIASKYTLRFDWGPLLGALFAGGPADPLTPAQRRYLGALVDNPELWDPTHGNAHNVFRDAGLPYDREACRALTSPTRPV